MNQKAGSRIVVFSALVVFCFVTVSAVFAETWSSAPVNPEFLEHQRRMSSMKENGVFVLPGTEGRSLGYVPSPKDISHIAPEAIKLPGRQALSSLPSKYDLRDYGFMTSVKDQNPYGTCWSFGAMASMESEFKKRASGTARLNNESSVDYDFSEWHLAYFAYVDESETMPAFTMKIDPSFGSDPIFDQGGNNWKAVAILARSGAVLEEDRPYQNVAPWPESSRPLVNDPVAKRLDHVYFLGADFCEELVKNALMTYGAVAFRIVWNNAAFNISTNAYYNVAGTGGGHIVTMVGWDDDYPAANFNSDPGANGAWLVKNSWGTVFGDAGYFWISYAEPTLGYPAVFVGADKNEFGRTYQYDPLGSVNNIGNGADTAWFSNVFMSQPATSGGSGSEEPELLKAVSFYSDAADSTYSIEIWVDPALENPRTGALLFGPYEGTLPVPGYHTVRFPSPVSLPPETSFSVVVRLTTPEYDWPVAYESPDPGYSDKARALANQSYVSLDGTSWTDLTTIRTNANVCLKAFSSHSAPVSAAGAWVIAGDEDYLYRYEEASGGTSVQSQWTFVGAKAGVVAGMSKDVCWIGEKNNEFLYSRNADGSWTWHAPQIRSVSPYGENAVWIVEKNSEFVFRYQGGVWTWNAARAKQVSAVSGDVLWLIERDSGNVYRHTVSTNAWEWTPVKGLSLSAASSDVVWVVKLEDNRLYRYDHGTKVWEWQPVEAVSVSAISESEAYYVGTDGALYHFDTTTGTKTKILDSCGGVSSYPPAALSEASGGAAASSAEGSGEGSGCSAASLSPLALLLLLPLGALLKK